MVAGRKGEVDRDSCQGADEKNRSAIKRVVHWKEKNWYEKNKKPIFCWQEVEQIKKRRIFTLPRSYLWTVNERMAKEPYPLVEQRYIVKILAQTAHSFISALYLSFAVLNSFSFQKATFTILGLLILSNLKLSNFQISLEYPKEFSETREHFVSTLHSYLHRSFSHPFFYDTGPLRVSSRKHHIRSIFHQFLSYHLVSPRSSDSTRTLSQKCYGLSSAGCFLHWP